MKVLCDTNVLLDLFLEREPFFENSSQVVGLAEQGKIDGWICGTTVTTIFYLLEKALSRTEAEKNVGKLLKIYHVANVNRVILEGALTNGFRDYEDGVLYQSAIHANLEAIITRNQKDFTKSTLPVYSPSEFLHATDVL
ncbi:Predicted nucleic acid-binding protein, contains PIN domain [Fodinibius roseus]|uniref:Predicted nucleic acid-binding protein, contains PIN domain n=1 Tax=Fodinibius roseus TaxID=1194090 RepID=A0A1M4URG4_9BACT|nr:PIN domain-containing protein [Fodinibius roseus]SHE59275.1 Predicted nucleic acid-binding protein, contains PIN domain [Fodinibius roseus]